MQIDLPYGESSILTEVPGGVRVEGQRYPVALPDPVNALEESLSRPKGAGPLEDILPDDGRVSVLVQDMTRGDPGALLLGALLRYLERRGAGSDRVEVFIAGGMHDRPGARRLARHLHESGHAGYRVYDHDASDGPMLEKTGVTTRGTECHFNRRVAGSSLIIGIGQVSFHYFAGFGGGRKLILPGIAGEKTILANHRLSLKEDPGEGPARGCEPGLLEGNPVHEDMVEGAGTIPPPVFMINTVKGAAEGYSFINAGGMEASHASAVAWMRERFSFPIEKRYRAVMVSAGGHPSDIDLLQSHKALRYASAALDQGGVLLAAAACGDGIGSTSLEECFAGGRETVPEKVRKRYTLNSQTAMSLYELSRRSSIYLKSSLPVEVANRFGMVAWEDGFEWFLLEGMDPADILVIGDSARFLPSPL